MKKIFFWIIVLFFFAPPISAATLKGGYPVCVSEESYKQFLKSYLAGNISDCEYLLREKCFFFDRGLKATVLEKSLFSASAKIRIFLEGQYAEMWTHYKNIEEK